VKQPGTPRTNILQYIIRENTHLQLILNEVSESLSIMKAVI
jgi:hypothetical protein